MKLKVCTECWRALILLIVCALQSSFSLSLTYLLVCLLSYALIHKVYSSTPQEKNYIEHNAQRTWGSEFITKFCNLHESYLIRKSTVQLHSRRRVSNYHVSFHSVSHYTFSFVLWIYVQRKKKIGQNLK